MAWIALLLAVALATAVYVAAGALAGRAVGLRAVEVSLGIGPTLFVLPLGGVVLRLAPLVLAGRVRFDEDTPALADKPAPLRAALDLAGVAASFLLACALLGNGAEAVARGTWTVLFELGAHRLEPAALWQSIAAFAGSASPQRLFGAVLAANAAINLMPLPPFAGGTALLALVGGLMRRPVPDVLARDVLARDVPARDVLARTATLAGLAVALWLTALVAIGGWRYFAAA